MARWTLWIILLAVPAGLFWWLTRPEPVRVSVVSVERGLVESTVANTRAGTVQACQRAKLSLPIGGQIANLAVHEGDHVEADTVLMTLWNEDLLARQLQARLAAETAGLEHQVVCIRASNLRREAERQRRLADKRLASDESVDQARSEAAAATTSCAAAEARRREAEAAIGVVQAELEKTRLRAPFAGIVAEVKGEVGEYATPSPPGVATPPAIDLLTDDCHYVEAPIDEVDAGLLKVGLPVRISFDAYPERSFPGRLRRIAPYVLDLEKQARTVAVEVEFASVPSIPLFAGYSADVEIVLQSHPETLRVPTEAVLEQDSVLLYQAGEALERRTIKPGISNWRYTEVLDGLQPGDRVVTSLGREEVRAGARVVPDD
ncbi:efflux RND transporter periplasmic adaptor subunit [Marinobacterium arenosum]|uniref:efflux RND transporter periplasmic adaptor subunit n=1 Tax=Marinobacterium arenosum TaxID=2862496 RepID=UPI001C98871D|nr:efflux RND transporter periplasmic adaptor subunit [Marinobacterium arenosum]MBY4675113.1 efflux RND transporter periplasmic adaptor subunit [Marinobacterium arenosum]